ncbi:unnamed protein product [Coregonus sp. 'balchen']|nr:unnamed protein product [Coregonus sp. 'balchen']
MLSLSQKSKRKKRQCFGDGLDTENTPHELIQQWSPPHKQRVVCKGKENEENQFVLARRPRKRREFSGVSWDSLPDELLLGILSCLPLQDLLRMFDESLWHSVDLVGNPQLDQALGQVLMAGVLGLRCPRTCIGEPHFTHTQHLRVQHMDLSSCTNTELVRLNLCGCSGFSPDSLGEMLKSCSRLEELNLSWCDFSTDHVKAVVRNIPSNITQLNLSGYRQNLTMEDVKDFVERCPHLVNLDLSDFEKFPELQTLEVYGLVQDTYLPILSKSLPRLQINTRPFSGVARPTEANRRDRTMWGMTCRLVFRS